MPQMQPGRRKKQVKTN